MNVFQSVGFEIRRCSICIHVQTERRQQGTSDSLPLNAGFDGHWSQMPVRSRKIAIRPFICPAPHTRRHSDWSAKHDRGQHAKLLKKGGLTKAGPCNAADSYKFAVAISPINQSPLLETE